MNNETPPPPLGRLVAQRVPLSMGRSELHAHAAGSAVAAVDTRDDQAGRGPEPRPTSTLPAGRRPNPGRQKRLAFGGRAHHGGAVVEQHKVEVFVQALQRARPLFA